MQLIDLLNIANRGYPDQWLSLLHHNQTGELLDDADKRGDTLALFIVRELTETFEPTKSSADQLGAAVGAIEVAWEDLDAVRQALAAEALKQA
jgi:hypothetical protein